MAHRVSVIVPTQKRDHFLRGSLESIHRLSGPDIEFEILVADNGREESTRRVALEYGAQYFPADKRGCAATRNVAFRAATGTYTAFLDDDDVWTPRHLRPQLKLLEENPELGAVIGQVVNTDQELTRISAPWPQNLPEKGDFVMPLLAGLFPQVGATVIRTSLRETVGIFDESLTFDQDWDWHLRIAEQYPMGYVPEECVLFRQRPRGSFDAMQARRVNYTRLVFTRHALREWKRWKSPWHFIHYLNLSVGQYYSYFADTALLRVEQGSRAAALRTICRAFSIAPGRALKDLTERSTLKEAWKGAFKSGSRPSRPPSGG